MYREMIPLSKPLELQDAEYRARLRQAMGIEDPEQIDPKIIELYLKKRRMSSILKEQMREAGLGELASHTRFRRG